MKQLPFTPAQLYKFITTAKHATYAGGGEFLKKSERSGFNELEYEEGDFYYRDSYVGYYQSRGSELVRYKGDVVWMATYGGGIKSHNDQLAERTFSFLKEALSQPVDEFQSVRGPEEFSISQWEYRYFQEGDITEFNGYEEIEVASEVIFFHRVIGGMVVGK